MARNSIIPPKKVKKVPHTDEAADKKMIKKMVKPSALTGKKCGGAVKK